MTTIDEPSLDTRVGARIRLLRRAKGITQVALAEALGLTFQQIQKYETGANRMTASSLWATARFLKVRVSDFFEEGDGDANTQALLDAWYSIEREEHRDAVLAIVKAVSGRG